MIGRDRLGLTSRRGGRAVYQQVYDLAIIGGGLTGTAIARDASGRGLSVFLCEQGDLAGRASSATNRLVHGGLHHLSRLDWAPLRMALVEREILLRTAPHLVRPLRFVLPHHDQLWPPWALGLGLFAYDRLARRTLPPCRRLDFEGKDMDEALHAHFRTGFAYSDCIADDARLVIANALDAQLRGTSINPRMRCVVAERDRNRWRLSLESETTGEPSVAFATILVNAAGGEAASVIDHVVHANRRAGVRMTRHSQIVVEHDQDDHVAYAFPDAEGRVVHCLPHEPGFVLIGTSSRRYEGDPALAAVDMRDMGYLANVANQYLDRPVLPQDIVQRLTSVTAMPDNPETVTGDHAVIVETEAGSPPLVSVFGGTLTTHRRMAEEVVDRLARFRKVGQPWTSRSELPGGSFPADIGAADLCRTLSAAYPFIVEAHAHRLVNTYGTRAPSILTGARSPEDLGPWFGADLTAAEVNFLRSEEWAMNAEDVLWRRTRLGLRFTAAEAEALDWWMAETAPAMADA